MGIKVDWYDFNQGTLGWKFKGLWDWADLDDAIKATQEYAQEFSGDLNIIYDVRQMGLVPVNVVSGLRNLVGLDLSYRGKGINIIVGADYYLKLLWHFMAVNFPPRWQVHFANTYDEAANIIDTMQQEANRKMLRRERESAPVAEAQH
jgi:hypothetical protein